MNCNAVVSKSHILYNLIAHAHCTKEAMMNRFFCHFVLKLLPSRFSISRFQCGLFSFVGWVLARVFGSTVIGQVNTTLFSNYIIHFYFPESPV